MLPQDEIDALLNNAQAAVDALATDVGTTGAPAHARPAASSGGAAVAVAPRPVARTAAPSRRASKIESILKLKVPVVVRLAERKMPVSQVVRMAPGTILEFDRTVGEELDLMINNAAIGRGLAVKAGEHFGLRITAIDSVAGRIQTLGGK